MSTNLAKNLLVVLPILAMLLLSAVLNGQAAPLEQEATPLFIKGGHKTAVPWPTSNENIQPLTVITDSVQSSSVASMIISVNIAVNQSIPDNDPLGISSAINIPYNLMIESVEVVSNVTHPQPTELDVTLISPSKVRSVLARAQIDNNRGETDSPTTRNLGQLSQGTWQLEISDKRVNNNGTFDNWQLVIRGKPIIKEQYLPLLVRDVPIIIDPNPNVTPLTPLPDTATPLPTNTPTRTPTKTPSTPTSTPTVTDTPTITPTPSETSTPTKTGSPTNTSTPRPTDTPRPTRTPGGPTVTPKPDIPPTATSTPECVSPFRNAGFEQGKTAWQVKSLNEKEGDTILTEASSPIQLPVEPVNNEWAAWLGGFNSEINSIKQTAVRIPTFCPYVTHDINIQSYDPDCTLEKYPFNPFDPRYENPFFEYDLSDTSDRNYIALLGHLKNAQEDSVDDYVVDLGGVIISHLLPNGDVEVGVGILETDIAITDGYWSLCDSPSEKGWGQVVYNTSYFAGMTVDIEFRTVTNAQKESSMFLDNVTTQRTRFNTTERGKAVQPVDLTIFTIKATPTP